MNFDAIAQIAAPNSVAGLRQRVGRSGRRGQPSTLRIYITEEALTKNTHPVDQLRSETFQAIATRARRDAAESLLTTTTHSIADVAFLTGFSDQTAFTRAFKRWTGSTPAAFRDHTP